MKKYDEVSVVKALERKSDISIDKVNKTIEIIKDSNEVGNGSWGKIDYLVKVHGYVYLFVKSHKNKKRNVKSPVEEKDEIINSKSAKHESKINAIKKIKSLMKQSNTNKYANV